MAREIKKAPTTASRIAKRFPTYSLHIKTITPVFGGGAVPGVVNTKTPVRASEVRGQLRFWWRATVGAQYKDSIELFKAEEDIWGSVEKPSPVSVRVQVGKQEIASIQASNLGPSKKDLATLGPLESFMAYPFRGKNRGLAEVEFKLLISIRSSSAENDVFTAVKAWLLFGGIGARTRRGLGALAVIGGEAVSWLPYDSDAISRWLDLPDVYGDRMWPTLAGAKLALGPNASEYVDAKRKNKRERQKDEQSQTRVLKAWRELGHFWARFRKGHFGVEYKPTGPTHWKDYHVLKAANSEQDELALSKPYFGLPIVYQRFNGKAPFSGTLEAQNESGSRMASPVILKPIAFANGEVRPAVLVLNAPPPTHIRISGNGRANGEYALKIPRDDPVMTRLEAGTPLEAALKAASELGWQEVNL